MSDENDDVTEADEEVGEAPEEAEADVEQDDKETLRHRVEESLERVVPEVLRRTLEAGLGTISRADRGRLRGMMQDLKVPRDVGKYLLAQVDETKNALLRVFAKEVREFLENTDLADDLRKVLTSISLEISTRVSFVPNESAAGVRPDVTATVKAGESRSPKRDDS